MKIHNKKSDLIILKAIFKENNQNKYIVEKENVITDFLVEQESFIYLGEKEKFNYCKAKKTVEAIINGATRNYQIDLESFVVNDICTKKLTKHFIEKYLMDRIEVFNLKTKKNSKKVELSLIGEENQEFEITRKFVETQKWTNNYQTMPPNLLNSEIFANKIVRDFESHSNLEIKVLNKNDIQELKMGLLLGVNSASKIEPRVVIINYVGDPNNKEKTVMVGKGITFDSGGMNLKPSGFITTMKMDMSGAAIVAGIMKMISFLKPKANISAIMCLTDNVVSNTATLPDSVLTSMNGKTVEINNTDAEGRLVLADGITYAIRELQATRIIDIATLTGAILITLGHTYTGVWVNCDKLWEKLRKAAKDSDELIWRLPLHEDFAKNIRKSEVADLKNTDLTRKAGSCSAAMFLKEFTEDKEFIHFDIAGSAIVGEKAFAPMIKTITNLLIN